jgi:hypothetical protein
MLTKVEGFAFMSMLFYASPESPASVAEGRECPVNSVPYISILLNGKGIKRAFQGGYPIYE